MIKDLQIEDITTYILDIPIERPHKFSTTTINAKSILIVRIHLTNGMEGIGEGTTPGIWWNGESVETMKVVIDNYMKPLLLNKDPRRVERHLQTIGRQVRANHFAKATIEMALYDVVGKYYNVPVHQLLGGLYQESLPVRWALATGEASGDLEEAKQKMKSEGYANFKIKSGQQGADYDVERAIAIAEGLKGVSKIGVDPNGSWDRISSVKWMSALNEAEIDFLEQPLPPWDIDGMAELTKLRMVPVMADESLATVQDAMAIAKKGAANIFSLKIHKSGGMKNTMKIAGIAEAAGISCFGGTSLESSIGTAACLHVYGSIPNLDFGTELFGPRWLVDDIVKEPLSFVDGQLFVPIKPGLGVEIDEVKFKKYLRK